MANNIFKKIFIFVFIAVLITVFFGFLYANLEDKKYKEKVSQLSGLSFEETSFLYNQGFIEKGSEKISLKPSDLKNQDIDSGEENFKVLATELGDNEYRAAFKIENKTDKEREFYLIPVSDNSEAEFKEISGVLGKSKIVIKNVIKDNLRNLYDVERHKNELNPELACAYDDIENNNYSASPIKFILKPNSTFFAQSVWDIKKEDNLKPVYFLIYGSAGGMKDNLKILNVYSHPSQGDNWEVYFSSRGEDELKIIPIDQRTIDDLDFVYLGCSASSYDLESAKTAQDFEELKPEILDGDIIYYKDWNCNGVAKIVHRVNLGGKHTLRFEFKGEEDYAYNSNLYWVGGAGGNTNDKTNWNTSNPGACNPGGGNASAAPGVSDVAIFDPDCDNGAAINANWSVGGININSGYTGTITQGNNITFTVSSSHYIQADGTFTGSNVAIDINGDFTLSGGTFNATSGTWSNGLNVTISTGTLNAGTGTMQLDGSSTRSLNFGSAIFNNVIINSGAIYNLTGTMDIDGDLTITSIYTFYTGTIAVAGDVTTTDAAIYTGSSTAFLFNGGIDQTLSANGGEGHIVNVNINKGGTLYIEDTIGVVQDWTYVNGTVNAGTSTVKFVYAPDINSGNTSFNDVIFNCASGGTANITSTMDVNGDLTITSMTVLYTGTIAVAGNITTTDTVISSSSTTILLIDGGVDQTLSANGGTGQMISINIDKGGNTLFIEDTIEIVRNFTHTNGIVDAGTSTIGFVASTGSMTISSGTMHFYNVIFNCAAGFTITGTMYIDGDLTFTASYNIHDGILSVEGNVTVVDSDVYRYLTALTFTGGNTQSFDLTGTEALWDGDIKVNKSGGQVNLLSNLTLNYASQDLIIEEGTFDINGHDLSVSGIGSTFVVQSGGNFQLQGGETTTVPTLQSGSTATYDGAGSILKDWTYHHLTINGSGTFTFGVNESLGGNFLLTAGTVDFNGKAITTTGDLTIAIGGQILGDADAMDGAVLTVGGNCDLNGESGDQLIFKWTAAWSLIITGTIDMDYVTFTPASTNTMLLQVHGVTATASYTVAAYSDASGAGHTTIDATDGTNTDNGNNENWDFGPTGPVYMRVKNGSLRIKSGSLKLDVK